MSNDMNIFERVFRLEAKINMMLADGKRDPQKVADILQEILREREAIGAGGAIGSGKHILEWQRFYKDVFGWSLDLSQVVIPPKRRGFGRVIVMDKEITLNLAYAKCKEMFPCWSHYGDDLDENIPVNERSSANGSYAIRVRNRVEADEELKNFSADEVASRKLATMTLLERILFELKWFKETGGHLDIQNITLCSGSRGVDGCVPSAYWYDGKFRVYWYHPDCAFGRLRPRAVSC